MSNFQVKISRVYTDMNGVILNKSAVPLTLQNKVPFYLFNLFDKNGGFIQSQIVKPPMPGMYFLYSYVNDTSYNFLDFQAGNTINATLSSGDLICVYGDDPNLPNFLCHVILHSDYVSYASFLANMQGKSYQCSHFNYITDNEQNWQEVINMTSEDDFGLVTDNKLQPFTYRDPYQFTEGFIDVKFPIAITDKQGLNSYMLFDTDSIELTFYIDTIANINSNISNNGNSNSKAVLYQVR